MVRATYNCEKCGAGYGKRADAEACEARPPAGAFPGLALGDLVVAFPADASHGRFGWYDGDAAWIAARFDLRFNPGESFEFYYAVTAIAEEEHDVRTFGESFEFYYVVTAIAEEEHDVRTYVETLAMSPGGYRGGWTSHGTHFGLRPAGDVPEVVRAAAAALVGHRVERLL